MFTALLPLADAGDASGPPDPAATACGCAVIAVIVVIGLAINMVPTFIAFARKHPNAPAILAVNLLLGWTCVGWIVALVWALTATTPPEYHVYHHGPEP